MNTTLKRVLSFAPELKKLHKDQLEIILEDVIRKVHNDVFGEDTEMAQRYLVAHYATLAMSPKNTAGSLSGKSVGDVSVNFQAPMLKKTTRYDTTSYGREYVNIRNSKVVAFRTYI